MEATLLSLLAQPSVTQADAAKVLNVSESYVSQLAAHPEFQAKLSKIRVETLTAETTHDKNLAAAESKALEKVTAMLDYVTKPLEAVRIFQALNSAKRRGASEAEQNLVINSQNTVVMLQLPATVKQKFITNNNNEVVQIGDRPMVTMDSQLLLSKVKDTANDSASTSSAAATPAHTSPTS